MLRIYFLQQWYTLADEALEDAIYDSQAYAQLRQGSIWASNAVPDATTLLHFRHLLGKARSDQADPRGGQRASDASARLLMRKGTIVDATIIAAPASTKERQRAARPGDASDQEGQ